MGVQGIQLCPFVLGTPSAFLSNLCSFNAKKFFLNLTTLINTDINISVTAHKLLLCCRSSINIQPENTMITAIIASVTPFVAAQPVDTAATMPEIPVATYNWSDQNAKPIISDEDLRNGVSASFCVLNGGTIIDDWRLA